MPKCKQCEGRGYTAYEEYCPACSGRGTVEWWESREYREKGKIPKEEVNADKGFTELGLIGGVLVGIGAYMLTLNSTVAIVAGIIATILAATLLRFIFKYILVILALSYLVYLLSG